MISSLRGKDGCRFFKKALKYLIQSLAHPKSLTVHQKSKWKNNFPFDCPSWAKFFKSNKKGKDFWILASYTDFTDFTVY